MKGNEKVIEKLNDLLADELAAINSQELAPYMCLSDYVVSKAFDRGLVRHETIAEGGEM